MRPGKGSEKPRLHPTGIEFGAGHWHDATDVGSNELKARQSHSIQHRHAQPEVVPCAIVVAAPLGGIALSSRKSRSGDDEGTFVGTNAQHAFASRERFQHAVHIVDLSMRSGAHLRVMHRIQVKCPRRTLVRDYNGFVHIGEISCHSLL